MKHIKAEKCKKRTAENNGCAKTTLNGLIMMHDHEIDKKRMNPMHGTNWVYILTPAPHREINAVSCNYNCLM